MSDTSRKKSRFSALDGIKERFGFGRGYPDDRDDFDDSDSFDEEYDERFEEYGDDGGRGYSRRSNSSSRYRDSSSSTDEETHSRSSYSSGYPTSPKLVSIDDVRARSAETSQQRYDADRFRHRSYEEDSSSYDGARRRPAGYASSATRDSAPSNRTRGYDSLFGGSSAANPMSGGRQITVVQPVAYDEAEKIASGLRRGDAVVLDLAATDQSIYKRFLDFSFGAASMVNARVDCLASKVFSIQTGDSLSSDEMNQLRNRNILR